MPGMMRRTWAAVAVPYFSRAKSGEGRAERWWERRQHLRRLAELTPTAPSPASLPSATHGDKAGRGKGAGAVGRNLGLSRLSGMGNTRGAGDGGEQRGWDRRCCNF